MGYGDEQLRELEKTIDAVECEAVIAGTPFELDRVISSRHPIRHVTYSLVETGKPDLADVLEPIIVSAESRRRQVAGAFS
jgi:predicted GTPase